MIHFYGMVVLAGVLIIDLTMVFIEIVIVLPLIIVEEAMSVTGL